MTMTMGEWNHTQTSIADLFKYIGRWILGLLAVLAMLFGSQSGLEAAEWAIVVALLLQ